MKSRHLIVLGALVVVLLLARLVMESREGRVATDLAEAGMAPLVEDPFAPGDVESIVVGTSDEPDALRVARQGAGWIVESAHGAPADVPRVEEFLDELAGLRGEVRGAGEGAWGEFGVDPEGATRVAVSGADGPLVELFLGRTGDGPGAFFARRAGADAVRHVRSRLRSQLGLIGDSTTPESERWVDLQPLDVDGDDVRAVRVERPDVTWSLARVDAGAPVPVDDEAGSDEADSWSVEAPELPWSVRSAAVRSQVDRLLSVRASGVADPSSPQCSLDEAAADVARVVVERDGEASVSYRLGPAGEDGGDVLLRVDGQPTCWTLSEWTARSLLPSASSLHDVPDAFTDPPASDDVEEVRIVQADGTELRLRRGDDDEWELASGSGEVDSSRVSRLVTTLRTLRANDVAEASRLDEATLATTATVTLVAGERRLAVELLGRRPGPVGARLVRASSGSAAPEGFVAVVSPTTADSLRPAVEDLVTE